MAFWSRRVTGCGKPDDPASVQAYSLFALAARTIVPRVGAAGDTVHTHATHSSWLGLGYGQQSLGAGSRAATA